MPSIVIVNDSDRTVVETDVPDNGDTRRAIMRIAHDLTGGKQLVVLQEGNEYLYAIPVCGSWVEQTLCCLGAIDARTEQMKKTMSGTELLELMKMSGLLRELAKDAENRALARLKGQNV
jgi:hypothetical protein